MESNIQSKNQFAQTSFYMEFADRLLPYKNNRPQLLALIKDAFDNLGFHYPFMEKNGQPIDDICPFTVFGCFNIFSYYQFLFCHKHASPSPRIPKNTHFLVLFGYLETNMQGQNSFRTPLMGTYWLANITPARQTKKHYRFLAMQCPENQLLFFQFN